MPCAGDLRTRHAEDPDNRVDVVVEEIKQQRQLRWRTHEKYGLAILTSAEVTTESERQAAAQAGHAGVHASAGELEPASPTRANGSAQLIIWGCSVVGTICAVHSGQRRAATEMLIVHSGQFLVVAALFRSSSFSSRLAGSTMA